MQPADALMRSSPELDWAAALCAKNGAQARKANAPLRIVRA
ncbi:hypothetical protein [Sinorhizobium sp. A49]|nr:hypothetical protein [Sinorhizobium sp. A49]